ncbi:(2Fe-2S)-binding protein [Streptomyces sp. NPDC047108]
MTLAPFTYRRRSCCLYYKVDGRGLCGDCVLHDRGGRGRGTGPARGANS